MRLLLWSAARPYIYTLAYISIISFYDNFFKVNYLILCHISRSVQFPFLVIFSHLFSIYTCRGGLLLLGSFPHLQWFQHCQPCSEWITGEQWFLFCCRVFLHHKCCIVCPGDDLFLDADIHERSWWPACPEGCQVHLTWWFSVGSTLNGFHCHGCSVRCRCLYCLSSHGTKIDIPGAISLSPHWQCLDHQCLDPRWTAISFNNSAPCQQP